MTNKTPIYSAKKSREHGQETYMLYRVLAKTADWVIRLFKEDPQWYNKYYAYQYTMMRELNTEYWDVEISEEIATFPSLPLDDSLPPVNASLIRQYRWRIVGPHSFDSFRNVGGLIPDFSKDSLTKIMNTIERSL